MLKILKLIAFLLILSTTITPVLLAQNIRYVGIFPTLDASGVLSEKLGYNVYLFGAVKPYESTEKALRDPARLFIGYGEAGISYPLLSNITASLSYVYERQNVFESNYRNENRGFAQLTWSKAYKKVKPKLRVRYDARFVQNRVTGETPFTNRLRFLGGLSYPLSKHLYFTGYSEFFFNTTSRASADYEENWSAIQLGRKLNTNHAVEFGYLYVGWKLNPQNEWIHQHYLQLTWVMKFG